MTDDEPVLWIKAVGVAPDEIDALGEKISEAVNEDYWVVVASEPISLLSREELLDELRESDEQTHD